MLVSLGFAHVGEILHTLRELRAGHRHRFPELSVEHSRARVLIPPRVQAADSGAQIRAAQILGRRVRLILAHT